MQLNIPALEPIQSLYQQTQNVQAAHPGMPLDLSTQMLHSYRWLEVFNDPEEYETGVKTIQDFLKILKSPSFQKKIHSQVRVALENNGYLYRTQLTGDVLDIRIHAAFCGAPEPVLEALALKSLGIRNQAANTLIQEYTQNTRFQSLETRLKQPLLTLHSNGRVHNLLNSFRRVNQIYFRGELSQPNLIWMPRRTRTRMGAYNLKTDTVTISPTLDNQNISIEVFDFIMYHELLHKKLSVREVNGRRYAHTPEFRRMEKMYPNYEGIKVSLHEYLTRSMESPLQKRTRRKGS